MKKSLTIFFLLIALKASAQQDLRFLFAINVSAAAAEGDLKGYFKKTYKGVNIEKRYLLRKRFSIGGSMGYMDANKVLPRAVYDTDKGTVSAVQTRYISTFPFLLTGHYYFSTGKIRPYAGLGTGIYIMHYEKWYGPVPFKNTSVRFGFRPEAGLLWAFGKGKLGINASVRYNYTFYNYRELNNAQLVEANLGIFFGFLKDTKNPMEESSTCLAPSYKQVLD